MKSQRSRLECEVRGVGNDECSSGTCCDDGDALDCPGTALAGRCSVVRRRRGPCPVPLSSPSLLWLAAAAACRSKQLLESGAKLLAEETVDERIDAAVGRTRPLSHRNYHLHIYRHYINSVVSGTGYYWGALHSHKIVCCYVLKVTEWIDKSWDTVRKCAMTNSRWWNLVNDYKHEAQRPQMLGHQ